MASYSSSVAVGASSGPIRCLRRSRSRSTSTGTRRAPAPLGAVPRRQDGRPIIVEGADGPQPIEVRGDFEVARPEGVPEGSPVDVAVAVNFSPLPLANNTRFTWHLTIDGESENDWQLTFSTRPARDTSGET